MARKRSNRCRMPLKRKAHRSMTGGVLSSQSPLCIHNVRGLFAGFSGVQGGCHPPATLSQSCNPFGRPTSWDAQLKWQWWTS